MIYTVASSEDMVWEFVGALELARVKLGVKIHPMEESAGIRDSAWAQYVTRKHQPRFDTLLGVAMVLCLKFDLEGLSDYLPSTRMHQSDLAKAFVVALERRRKQLRMPVCRLEAGAGISKNGWFATRSFNKTMSVERIVLVASYLGHELVLKRA